MYPLKHAVAFTTAGLLSCVCGISCTTPEPQAWWFSTEATATPQRRYELEYEKTVPDSGFRNREECVVTVKVEADEESLTWRLLDAREQCKASGMMSLCVLWIQWLQESRHRSTRVTANEVLWGDWPLLRGPWHAGDRQLIAIYYFANFWFHAEVLSAGTQDIHLRFDYRIADSGFGSGELWMAKYTGGLRHVRAQWTGEFGVVRSKHVLTINRLDE